MNLDDFLNGQQRIVDVNAESLPEVYGLNDDEIVSKVKRLVEVAMSEGVQKDHDVIESVFNLGETELERVVLSHLLGKYFVTTQQQSMSDMMTGLSMALTMSVMKTCEALDLDEDAAQLMTNILMETIDEVIE